MAVVFQTMSWHQTTAANILKHILTVIRMVWTMATWLLQLQKATATIILISVIALHQHSMKRNSDTIYCRRVRFNTFVEHKKSACNHGIFHGALLCKEINCLGECLEVTIRKTWKKRRNSEVCNREVLWYKSCECADVCDWELIFHVKYSHERLLAAVMLLYNWSQIT